MAVSVHHLAELQPQLDVHRLARRWGRTRAAGGLRLLRGLFLRWRLDVAAGTLALSAGDRPWQTYRLAARDGGRTAVLCLGCGKGAEVLYWPTRFGQAAPGSEAANLAGCCQDCCRLRMLSEGHGQEVAALRADLRLGDLESVQQALEAGRYVPARTAMELEGVVAERLFTRPPAAPRRWKYPSKERHHGLSR